MSQREQGASATGSCATCGATGLERHLVVNRGAGTQGLIPTTNRFGSALADIVRCPACGHMQLSEVPTQASLVDEYVVAESTDYLAEELGQRATARTALEMIERHVSPGALLDVGCWVGFLLHEARSRGWRTVGLEPSVFASGYAREALGLEVHTVDLFEADLPPDAFDAAVMSDVIEHLPDPGAGLRLVARSLKPGAVVYLALPDAGSRLARLMGARWWSVIPTHVQYFTRGSLRTLLTRLGWQVLEMRTAPKTFTWGYYLDRLGGYSTGVSRGLVAAAERTGIADRAWTPDFRDRVAVLARAPDRG